MIVIHAHGVNEITNGTTNLTGAHVHAVRFDNGTGSSGMAYESGSSQDGTYNTNSAGDHQHTVNIPAFDTNSQYDPNRDFDNNESRPKNICMNYIIKAL